MVLLPELSIFLAAWAALFLLPGFLLTVFLPPQDDLDLLERLPLGFSFSLGLFLVPFGMGAFFSWSWMRVQVVWAVFVVALITVALIAWRMGSVRPRLAPDWGIDRNAWLPVLLALLALAAILTIFTARDEDDWSYYQIVRSFADANYLTPIPLTALRSGLNVWWFFHAFMLRTFQLDIVHLGRDYVPLVMVPLAFLALYSLARALFVDRKLAVLACVLQLAFFVIDLSYNDPNVQLTGGWVLGRIDQDHTAAQFVFLPVYAMAIIRFIRSASLRWLAASFLALLTVTAVHPQGFVQAGIVLAALVLPFLFFHRFRGPEIKRALLLAAPYAGVLVMLLPFIMSWRDIGESGALANLASLADGQTVFPFTFRWIMFITPGQFVLLPGLLGQPALFAALLLTPWLVWQARTDLAGQYLLGLMLGLVLILYNPFLLPPLSQWIGWGIYRLWYLFPAALVLAYAAPHGGRALRDSLAELRGRTFGRHAWPALVCAVGLVLVAARFPAFVRGTPSELGPGHQLPEGTQEMLQALRGQALATGGVVMAPRDVSDAIPSYHLSLTPILFRYHAARERIADVSMVYDETLITFRDLEILDKYQVVYLVVPTEKEVVSQFDFLEAYFSSLYRNEYWALYRYSPPRKEDPVIRANSLFIYGEWQGAVDAYGSILGTDRPVEPPLLTNDLPGLRLFLPFAGLEYDPGLPGEEVKRKLNDTLSLAHTGLGLLLAQSNLPRKAVAELEQAVRLEPGNLQAHYHLSALYHKLGMEEEAATHARASGRLIQYGPK